jgi:hypothetical protein
MASKSSPRKSNGSTSKPAPVELTPTESVRPDHFIPPGVVIPPTPHGTPSSLTMVLPVVADVVSQVAVIESADKVEGMDSRFAAKLSKGLRRPGTSTNALVSQLNAHPFNPRKPNAFSRQNARFISLVKNMLAFGYNTTAPVACHPYHDGPYIVGEPLEIISGHRRVEAAREAGIPEIPVMIYTDLSKDDVLRLVMDHELTQGLDVEERLSMFNTLVDNGYDKLPICDIMGLRSDESNGHEVNEYAYKELVRLRDCPVVTQRQILDTKMKGRTKSGIKFKPTVDAMKSIHAAVMEDRSNNHLGDPAEGPAFKAVLAKLETKGTAKSDPESSNLGPITPEKLLAIAQVERCTPLEQTLRRIGGFSKSDLSPWLQAIRFAWFNTFGYPDGVLQIERRTVEATLNAHFNTIKAAQVAAELKAASEAEGKPASESKPDSVATVEAKPSPVVTK